LPYNNALWFGCNIDEEPLNKYRDKPGNENMKTRNAFPLQVNSGPLSLALQILAIAMVMEMAGAYAASTNMDIDYSHNVVGTGTVMTDFKMGSDEGTQATGKVRGSGEVMNKYVFVSNSSVNVSIEDQFLFTKIPVTHEITIRDYPQMTKSPGSFRLLGTTWAAKINLTPQNDGGKMISFPAHGNALSAPPSKQ
jgi:hypothetical protein